MDVSKMNREILFTREEIASKVADLGMKIQTDYEGKKLLVIALLKGSFVFAADLIRSIDQPLVIEFMITSSYGHDTSSSGDVKVIQDVSVDISEYDVLIVDDIIDSGHTMKSVYELLKKRNPRSLKTCTLLDKPSRRDVEFTADYTGFVIPDKFIVGYGLNFGDYYRNVDHIFAFVE